MKTTAMMGISAGTTEGEAALNGREAEVDIFNP
jgi:hypothetical protein